jgi:hypothetical protein
VSILAYLMGINLAVWTVNPVMSSQWLGRRTTDGRLPPHTSLRTTRISRSGSSRSSVKFVTPPKVEISVSKLIELNVIIQLAGPPSDIRQDAFARFRETIFWARSMKARKLAAMWRRPE